MHQLTKLILLFPGLFLCLSLNSQHYSFENYTVREGLAQSSVWSMVQDSRGYLWLGTNGGGLSRFDGHSFESYTVYDGLSGNTIRGLYEDSRGELWIGTENGVDIFNGRSFRKADTVGPLAGSVVLSIYEDSRQDIWVGTGTGAFRIQRNDGDSLHITQFLEDEGLTSRLIWDIVEDDLNRVWLVGMGGINMVKITPDTLMIEQFRPYIHVRNSQITSAGKDKEGQLWFGSYNSGAFRIKPVEEGFEELEYYNTVNGLMDDQILDVMADHNGDIWIASGKGGITKHSGTGFEYFTEKEGLVTNEILSLYQDSEDNIWIGTDSQGLMRLSGPQFSHYGTGEGLITPSISCIAQDAEGYIWLTTSGGGLTKAGFENGDVTLQNLTQSNGLAEDNLTSVCIGEDGSVWFSYYQSGFGVLDGSGITNISEENGLISNYVNCLFIDSRGDLWCGTKGGVSNFTESGFLNLRPSQIGCTEIHSIVEDKNGDIWFGAIDGLSRFDRDARRVQTYDQEEGLNYQNVNALCTDAYGNVWIGTFGGGLYMYDASLTDSMPIRLVADSEQLGSNNIFSLVSAANSILLVGTDKGFDRLVIDAGGSIVDVRNYDATDGFIGGENNRNAIYTDKNGRVWFGTVNGLTCYSPDKEPLKMPPPRIHVSDVKIWFEEINWTDRGTSMIPWFRIPESLKVKHSDNHLTFSLSGISHSNPSRVRFRYMVEGLSPIWSPPFTDREVLFQGLKPGKYTFNVSAANAAGIWTDEPVSYSFMIKPPFWRTAWFFGIIVILLALMIFSWVKFRERQLRRKNKELETKVLERTAEIRKQKTEIEEKNRNLESANTEIREQKEIIEVKNRDITDSILYAKRIQEALLPSSEMLKDSVKDSFIIFRPKDIVSGDFYWVRKINGELVIVAADCTGHGVPGAFMSMLGISFLDQIVLNDNITDPGLILNRLRGSVVRALKQKGHETDAKDGMDIAICTVDFDKNVLTYAGAYNPLWFFRGSEFTEKKADRMPVAIHTRMDDFATHKLEFREGDTLYMFSDGYADQFGGPKGKKFKPRSFQELLLELQDQSMEDQKDRLNKAFDDWKGDNFQVDDIVVVGVRL